MWCENGGGTGCGGGNGDSTVENDDDNDIILIIAGNTNLENNSILQPSMHKSSMLADKVN